MVNKNATSQIFLTLGGMGAVVHAALLWWSGFRREPTTAWANSGDGFAAVMNVTLVVLGAIFYALFLRWPVNGLIRNRRISVGLVLWGGLLGMFATFAALQGRYLAGAVYLTYELKVVVAESGLHPDFLLSVIEIETYRVSELFYFLVPAFPRGALVTTIVSRSFFTKAFPQSDRSA